MTARQLHDRYCRFNHTDECSVGYGGKGEVRTLERWEHVASKLRALADQSGMSVQRMLEVYDIAHGIITMTCALTAAEVARGPRGQRD